MFNAVVHIHVDVDDEEPIYGDKDEILLSSKDVMKAYILKEYGLGNGVVNPTPKLKALINNELMSGRSVSINAFFKECEVPEKTQP